MSLSSKAALIATAVGVLLMSARSFQAQTDGTCVPVSERAGREFGCFITAREELGALPAQPPLYWHLDAFPTVAAARAAKGPRGTVVESLGRIWLFTIAGIEYRPAGGTRVDRIGPLPLVRAERFAAVYMEGIFKPGMSTEIHRHPGMEAWYTLEGSMCLETPSGRLDQRAGDPGVLVPDGVPMRLTGTGTGPRRSVVLILQDTTLPRSTPAHDWTPRGLCDGAASDAVAELLPSRFGRRRRCRAPELPLAQARDESAAGSDGAPAPPVPRASSGRTCR